MKVWNLSVKRGVDGSKHLDIQMHGVIDGGWYDEDGVDTAETIAELGQHRDAKTIRVGINSIGGSAFGGVAMYNALEDHPGEVTCCVEGLAASAASLVAMAGKTVMGKGSMLMIHPPSAMAMGNAKDLRKTADVLDKIQEGLSGIYQAKTGKSAEEVKGLVDDETWMTADEAVAAGFADEVMPDVKTDYGPGEHIPTEENDEDGDEPQDRAPQIVAEGLKWGGVTFPLASLPQQIIAMAKKTARAIVPAFAIMATDTAMPYPGPRPLEVITAASPSAAPVLAIVPQPAPEVPLTRAELARRAPELLAALIKEGRDAGLTAERARLQAIDDLDVKGCAELVAAAKYGEKLSDAPTLAMAVVKAGKVAGADLLAARRSESEAINSVVIGSPDNTEAAEEARLIKAMVAGGNARRGGTQ